MSCPLKLTELLRLSICYRNSVCLSVCLIVCFFVFFSVFVLVWASNLFSNKVKVEADAVISPQTVEIEFGAF